MKAPFKLTTFKRAFILLWNAIATIIAGLFNCLATMTGMTDKSKYGIALRRVVLTCFAIIMVIFAVVLSIEAYSELKACHRHHFDEDYYITMLSDNVLYYKAYYSDNYDKDYICDHNGKKSIKGLHWIAISPDGDSLVCYSNGDKRGYFNKFTGEPVIDAIYEHAWVFSDGLAATISNGTLKYIDKYGNIVIDTGLEYQHDDVIGSFHKGYCVLHQKDTDTWGLIDHSGNYVLQPEFESITWDNDYWIATRPDKQTTLLNSQLESILSIPEGSILLYDDYISVTLPSHHILHYDYQGNQMGGYQITSINYLTYEKPELEYSISSDEEGTMQYYRLEETAQCLIYEAERDWYGLMTPDGKFVTPPSYRRITAISRDLYLCSIISFEEGELLNSKGQVVSQKP
ncbi:MAG: WG repeat-containing protein [Muribaculaceae bacterium]